MIIKKVIYDGVSYIKLVCTRCGGSMAKDVNRIDNVVMVKCLFCGREVALNKEQEKSSY